MLRSRKKTKKDYSEKKSKNKTRDPELYKINSMPLNIEEIFIM